MEEEERLILLGKQWDEAMVENNVQEIGKFMADDWVIVGTEGGITSRAAFLESIRSGMLVHSRMDVDEIRVKVYDNTGIITSRGTSAGTYNGEPFSFYEWASSVFVKKEEKWRCVLTMLTPV